MHFDAKPILDAPLNIFSPTNTYWVEYSNAIKATSQYWHPNDVQTHHSYKTNWWNSSQLYSTANKSFGYIYVFLMHTFFHISQIFPTANLYQRILQWVNIMEVSIEFKPKRLKIQTNWDPMQTLVSNSDLLDIFQPEILYFLIATIYYWYPCFQPNLSRASDNYFWLGFTLFVSRLLHFLC